MTQNKTAKKKSTFSLSQDLLIAIKELIPARGSSQNAIVEEALRKYVAEYKREILRKQYLEASRDSQFMADIEVIETDFQSVDAETARMIP